LDLISANFRYLAKLAALDCFHEWLSQRHQINQPV
jgi:hypothetical protein